MKKNNRLYNKYDKYLIELFERACVPSKMTSSHFHDENHYRTMTWKAIPLGIPPMLINGICINDEVSKDLIENLDVIQNLFPKAVIFNQNKDVLRYSLVDEKSSMSMK